MPSAKASKGKRHTEDEKQRARRNIIRELERLANR